jgi:hypothetical protein
MAMRTDGSGDKAGAAPGREPRKGEGVGEGWNKRAFELRRVREAATVGRSWL